MERTTVTAKIRLARRGANVRRHAEALTDRCRNWDVGASGFSGSERAKADDGARTHDPQLGKLMLYQLSYVRLNPEF
jgi:hypothetical protein